MTTAIRHLRPILVGLVALLLTAGLAFAANPHATPPGLAVAEEAAGKVVPVKADQETEEEEEPAEEEEEEEEPAVEEEQSEEAGENCTTDPSDLSDEELAEMRHGSVVCWAAHQETPDGYDNHGAFVSEWAKKNHGQDQKAQKAKPHQGGDEAP